ncbi:hypothetical protein G9A89_009363 [Geosiphon pyriformis]|nr:hypothetical protein G9A89_009363 [Geosiphon pyriformis]
MPATTSLIKDYYDLEARWFTRHSAEGGFQNEDGSDFPVSVTNLLRSLKYRAAAAGAKTLTNYLAGITGYHEKILKETSWKENVRMDPRITEYIKTLRGTGDVGLIREKYRREGENRRLRDRGTRH